MKTRTKLAIALMLLAAGWQSGRFAKGGIRAEHRAILEKQARMFCLDPKLVEAVVLVESGGNPRALSPKNARGLMQLLPETARQLSEELGDSLGTEDLYLPEINIRLGCYYLHALLRRFRGDLFLALAAYNTGPKRVEDWLESEPGEPSRRVLLKKAGRETRFFLARVWTRYGE